MIIKLMATIGAIALLIEAHNWSYSKGQESILEQNRAVEVNRLSR